MRQDAAPKDVLVVDMIRILAGPFASMRLGGLGADVFKVEEPETGDTVLPSSTVIHPTS